MNVALCITGEYRNYNDSLSSFKLGLQGDMLITVFLALWERTVDASVIDEIENTFGSDDRVKKIYIKLYDSDTEFALSGKNLILERRWGWPKGIKPHPFEMFYLFKEGAHLVQKISKDCDINFDLIIKTRSDLGFINPININVIGESLFARLDREKIIYCPWIREQSQYPNNYFYTELVNDSIHIGRPSAILEMCDLIDNIDEYISDYEQVAAESLLYRHLLKKSIKTFQFKHMPAVIQRRNFSPNDPKAHHLGKNNGLANISRKIKSIFL